MTLTVRYGDLAGVGTDPNRLSTAGPLKRAWEICDKSDYFWCWGGLLKLGTINASANSLCDLGQRVRATYNQWPTGVSVCNSIALRIWGGDSTRSTSVQVFRHDHNYEASQRTFRVSTLKNKLENDEMGNRSMESVLKGLEA